MLTNVSQMQSDLFYGQKHYVRGFNVQCLRYKFRIFPLPENYLKFRRRAWREGKFSLMRFPLFTRKMNSKNVARKTDFFMLQPRDGRLVAKKKDSEPVFSGFPRYFRENPSGK